MNMAATAIRRPAVGGPEAGADPRQVQVGFRPLARRQGCQSRTHGQSALLVRFVIACLTCPPI